MTETKDRVKVDAAIWNSECINYLRKITRQHKFDFDKVCTSLKSYLEGKQVSSESVSADTCRRVFAGDYYSESVPSIARPAEESQLAALQNKDLTYSQIVEIIEAREEENTRKQEKVFARVLSSLQQADDGSLPAPIRNELAQGTSQLLARMEEQAREKEERKKKIEVARREQQEREELQKQREALRRRFEEKFDSNPQIKSEIAEIEEDGIPDIDMNVDHINIRAVFESKEFDKILDELEADIAMSSAPGKNQEDALSAEIQEIFKILDSSPVDNSNSNISYSSYSPPFLSEQKENIDAADNTIVKAPVSPTKIIHAAKIAIKETKAKTTEPVNLNNRPNVNSKKGRNPFNGLDVRSVQDIRAETFSSSQKYSDSDDEDDDNNWLALRSSAKKRATANL